MLLPLMRKSTKFNTFFRLEVKVIHPRALMHKNLNHLTFVFLRLQQEVHTSTDEGHTNDNYQILTKYILQDRHPVLKK